MNQAQLLSDTLYYAPGNESQPWLIYYISKPLLGTYDPGGITQAVVPGNSSQAVDTSEAGSSHGSSSPEFARKELESFAELLANFPMIARQMQPGLERLFREFGKELGKPLPPPPSRTSYIDSEHENLDADETASISSILSTTQKALPFSSPEYFEDDEDLMRRALETAVTAAIDLFRLVDRQQLSLLGATTNLTGPMVERLIERYVTEQVHDSLLFPRVCGSRKVEDTELDIRIRQMENIDVSQVGITIEGGRQGKEELIHRLGKGVDEFRKMADAKSPQEMLRILLATIKTTTLKYNPEAEGENVSEKHASVLTINADVLVSLLLVVIVRSQIRHLQARLLYMQQFIYIDDVEGGEFGYALSTFEAVLTYLRHDSGGLRKASSRNKRLWSATKSGNIAEMKVILEPDNHDSVSTESFDDNKQTRLPELDNHREESLNITLHQMDLNVNESVVSNVTREPSDIPKEPETPRLAHVFPFQTWAQNSPPKSQQRAPKRVSMDVGSISEASNLSYLSRSTTFGSVASCMEGDVSIEILTKTQDPAGDSVPMMAVEACQPGSLKYLLSLEDYYPIETILEDVNSDGTTLLSAAVQLAHTEIVDIILNFIFDAAEPHAVAAYLAKPDARGRTVAHYIFSVPSLMSRVGTALPWRHRDKHGQTPLFALCRSYDHTYYNPMVNEALAVAREAQGDGQPLRLDDHVDARGNTLLHVVSDPQILHRILRECDCDPNATNEKRFTPLMMASKYGRVDLVRVLFADPRVDVHLRESRGLTAVELAKDDEVRNRIDDLILFSNPPSSPLDFSGRITAVVRSVFVEDGSIRFIIKSGAPNPRSSTEEGQPKMVTYTVTTCRRSLADFENLIKFLRIEHPASYIPEIPLFRSPLQILSKPSRAVLHEVQERLDKLIKTLLAHPTFATHEFVWEFFLMPEIQTEMTGGRSHQKAAALAERIADDYQPVTAEEIRDVEQIVGHAQDAVRAVSIHSRSIIRRGYKLHNASTDFAEAISMCTYSISSLQAPTSGLPQSHIDAFNRFAACYASTSLDSSPLTQFLTALSSSQATTAAMLESLARPGTLIARLTAATRSLARAHSTLASSSLPRKFSFPGLEESRQRSIREQGSRIVELNAEIDRVGKEIAWNKDVVVGELAGWTDWRGKLGKDAIRDYVKTTLVREKERGKRMERCLRGLKR